MSHSRRDFLKTTSSAAAFGLVARAPVGTLGSSWHRPLGDLPSIGDSDLKELAMRGIDAAKSAGATYADIRIGTSRVRRSDARDHTIALTRLINNFQFGVRVIAGGAWGFAS